MTLPSKISTGRRHSTQFPGWLVLVFFLAAAFAPVLGGKQTLLSLEAGVMPDGPYEYAGPRPAPAVYDPAASAIKYVPFTKLVSDKWRRFELPFWNPYAGCGVPLLANAESFATSPLRLPLYVSPSPAVWDFYYLLRLFLAGWLCYLFARSLKLSSAASLAAATAWMLGGYLLLSLNLFHLDVDIFLPGLLLLLDRLLVKPSAGSFLGASVLTWQMCLGGNQQALLVDMLLVGAWIVMRLAEKGRGPALPSLALAFLSLGAGAAGALLHWLPLLELLSRAHHLHAPGGLRSGLSSAPASSLLSIAMPPRHSPPFYYAGATVSALALAGMFSAWLRGRTDSRGKLPFKVLTAVVLFELAKIGGLPGVSLIGVLPVLSNVWWVKYAAPLFLGIALLAGRGLDTLAGAVPSKARAAAALAGLVLLFGELSLLKPGPYAARHDPLKPAPYVGWLARALEREPFTRICGLGTTFMPMLATAFNIPDVRMEDSLIDRRQYRVLFEGFSAPKPPKFSMYMTLDRLDPRRLENLRNLGVGYMVTPKGWVPERETAAQLSLAYDKEVRIYRVSGSRRFAGFPPRGMRWFSLGLFLSPLLSVTLLCAGFLILLGTKKPLRRGAGGI